MPAILTKNGQRFYFWALPKTGTEAVRSAMHDLGAVSEGPQHDYVPKTAGATGVRFGTVRNPLDWYASLWWYSVGHGRAIQLVERLAGGKADFPSFVIGATSPGPAGLVGVSDRHDITIEEGSGLWSASIDFFFGVPDAPRVDALIDMDALTEGLTEVLGFPVDVPTLNTGHFRETRQAQRRSKQAPSAGQLRTDYSDWYDDELIARVWEKDGRVAEALGYREPFGISDAAVHRFERAE